MSVFVDTNVLIYAIFADEHEAAKRDRARAILRREPCVFSMQVLQEFIVQSTHPRRIGALSVQQAGRFVAAFRKFPVQENTLPLLDDGMKLFEAGGFSFWDSMIVAAARAQGCEILYSEDMQDGRIVGGLRIVNPFR